MSFWASRPTRIRSAALAVLLGGAAAFLALRRCELDLIEIVVQHALVQKAPGGAWNERASRAFAAARHKAEVEGKQTVYLEQLLRLSQRLEKVQSLDAREVERLLKGLPDPEGPDQTQN